MIHRTWKLIETLKKCNNAVGYGAEVGVQFGKNAYGMLKAHPQLRLLLVDSYDASVWTHYSRTVQQGKDYAMSVLSPFADRTQWLIMPSVDAAKHVENGCLDYVFIDAGHFYDDVKSDIEAWLPKIKPGGVMAGHDYSRRFRGVQHAVDERFGAKRERWGDLWWVKL